MKYRVFVYENGMQVGSFVSESVSQRFLARGLRKSIKFNVVPLGCQCGLCTDREKSHWCRTH